jgi:uncharacterized Zn-binding protein involved in type VI secretion
VGTVAVNPPKTPVTKGSSGIAMATIPNICKMPGPPAPFVPTPLPNIGKSGMSPDGYSTSVTFDGDPVAIQGASFGSMGDVASKALGGGMISMNTEGPTKFIAPGSMNVQVEGKNVQLLGDQMMNNCGPGGSPANAATMGGVLQVPEVVFAGDLDALAEKCNKETNKANNKCNPGPQGADCTTLGTAKHKCCENAIKKYNESNPNSPFESEVPFDGAGNRLSATAESDARSAANDAYYAAKDAGQSTKGVWATEYFGNGGAAFKADVLVKDGKGGYSAAYDFKFNCKPEGSTGLMKQTQSDKYFKAVGVRPKIIHKDGRKC